MPNLHPFFTHFPIALLSLSFVCECAAILLKTDELSRVGWWTQLAGSIGLAAAAASGILAARSVQLSAAVGPYVEVHEEIAFVSAAVFAVLLFWRIASGTRRPRGRDALFMLMFGAGVVAIWLGAWYGGEMVYRFGAGVQTGFPP
jgi:uncharacterized membrane protein